jgi:hypothetical protein
MLKAAATTGLVCATLATALATGLATGPRFYRDDPIARDPETQDASRVRTSEISKLYDVAENSFFGAGERVDKGAVNVNTTDEVPDSSWFTNRLGGPPTSLGASPSVTLGTSGRGGWTTARLAKGPDTTGPSGDLTIISGKMEGRSPGFIVRDSAGQQYFIKFDPPSNPEMASGAEVITTKFLYAFGYNVPENYIATIRRESLKIGDVARVEDDAGRKRQMEPDDLELLLKRAARRADGSYRALASKVLEGTPVGPFRYYGTRSDDPNDIFPHEHRRELRGLLAFCAWLNHDNSQSTNTLDTLITSGGKSYVRHNLLDFGSSLGSGTVQAQSPRAGNEFIWDARPTFITMLTLGFYVRPWIKVEYPEMPSVGRIESTYFNPRLWKPEYPNAAFANARPEDWFWAAQILAAIPDDGVKAVVQEAQFSDPKATAYLTDVLLSRRSKVLQLGLNGTNPVVNPALSASGELTFENAAHAMAVANAAERYTIQWSTFDNASATHKDVGSEQTVRSTAAQAPAALFASQPEYVSALVRAFHVDQPAWSQPLRLYFRRSGDRWSLVGLERH